MGGKGEIIGGGPEKMWCSKRKLEENGGTMHHHCFYGSHFPRFPGGSDGRVRSNRVSKYPEWNSGGKQGIARSPTNWVHRSLRHVSQTVIRNPFESKPPMPDTSLLADPQGPQQPPLYWFWTLPVRASCASALYHSASYPDPWLEACVYACARLLSMAMHAYVRLHPNTPHACVRLGSGTQRWTSCIVMHRFSAEKKLVLVEFLFKSTVRRKGT